VCVGVPSNLETREFEYKKGDKAGTAGEALSFVLAHPATSMSGSVQCETRNESLIEDLRKAHEAGDFIEVTCVPDVVNYTRDGEERHFFKLRAVAIVPA